ncbi:MAG TPA: hypothetical protein VFA33_22795 [Bryobacteraceae bacterium]|nr:hypothetical protein [Bryobacteraceae bacterium]
MDNDAPTSDEFADLVEHVKARALDQARHVPWRRLAHAVDEANQWEAFNLWLRAVADAARCIPPVIERELEARIPGLLAQHHSEMGAASIQGALGYWLWNLVGTWVTVNLFLEPKLQGWLDAIPFFLSKSLPYMKAWAHWGRVNREWRTNPPLEWPTFEQWQSDIAAVTQLADPDSVPQRVLEAVSSVSAPEWERLLTTFFDLMAFSMWMELILDLEGPNSRLVSEEIGMRYQGFSLSNSELSSEETVRELNLWVIERDIAVKGESLLAALSWHAQHHPAYYALRNYVMHCHDAWPDDHPSRLPAFDDWRKAADNYTS